MPDTGLPWEIPYAAPADLVRDWPALSEDVAEAVAAGLSAAQNAGIGSNVVTFTTSTSTTTTSGGYVDTLVTASITPTSDTSKVLVLVSIGRANANGLGRRAQLALFRGTSAGTNIADLFSQSEETDSGFDNGSVSVLDSPATAAAQTYTVGLRSSSSGSSVTVQAFQAITLIEVAA